MGLASCLQWPAAGGKMFSITRPSAWTVRGATVWIQLLLLLASSYVNELDAFAPVCTTVLLSRLSTVLYFGSFPLHTLPLTCAGGLTGRLPFHLVEMSFEPTFCARTGFRQALSLSLSEDAAIRPSPPLECCGGALVARTAASLHVKWSARSPNRKRRWRDTLVRISPGCMTRRDVSTPRQPLRIACTISMGSGIRCGACVQTT